jgi:hypothetical protein
MSGNGVLMIGMGTIIVAQLMEVLGLMEIICKKKED